MKYRANKQLKLRVSNRPKKSGQKKSLVKETLFLSLIGRMSTSRTKEDIES
jgi:hypothetical protein